MQLTPGRRKHLMIDGSLGFAQRSTRPFILPSYKKNISSVLTSAASRCRYTATRAIEKITKAASDSTIPNGAVHIVLKSVDDAKQVFVYSSMLGIPEVPEPHDGLHRVEVNEKGKVAAVTILKGISPNADTFVMKQLVAWYAKPGPLRIVDVPVRTLQQRNSSTLLLPTNRAAAGAQNATQLARDNRNL